MLKQAITELYNEFPYSYSIKYSGKFKPYRANVKLIGGGIQFSLSKKWKGVSKEIQSGLVQELLLKILKKRLKPLKKSTSSIELYNIFMKKVHISAPKIHTDPILESSFVRVNEQYFYGLLDMTNLKWGNNSLSKLGSYEYGSDTIVISKVLSDDFELLDYVMYHEMLHKKHKFKKKNGRSYHHTTRFKKDEKEFENSKLMDRRLNRLLVKNRFSFKSMLRGMF